MAPIEVAVVILAIIYFANFAYLDYVVFYFVSFALMTVSWDFLYSYTGQLSLGQAFQFGLGALVTLLAISNWHLNFGLAMIVGTMVTVGVGGAVGATTIRLKPGYQGIALLLVSQVFYWLTYIIYSAEGISVFALATLSQNVLYVVGIAIFVPSIIVVHIFQSSKYRVKLLAIRGDNLAAEVSGINVNVHKTLAFLISSFFAGVSGSFFAIFNSHFDYTFFAVTNSFLPIGMAIVGGMGLLEGSILGTAIIVGLLNLLPIYISLADTYIIYGAMIVVVLRLVPKGLARIILGTK